MLINFRARQNHSWQLDLGKNYLLKSDQNFEFNLTVFAMQQIKACLIPPSPPRMCKQFLKQQFLRRKYFNEN